MIKITSLETKLVIFLVLFSLFFFAKTAQAKVLPQAKGIQRSAPKNATGTGINVFPKLRGDRKALIVNFANLQNATSVSYLLTYRTNIQDEGAMGSLPIGSSSNTTELLFGTCSKNVCRYHIGIKDAKLEISYTSKAGKKYLKRYRIKV